jgi:hypothetical protein
MRRIAPVLLALYYCCSAGAQTAWLRSAPTNEIHTIVDGNSPSFWRDGQFNFLTSTGTPVILRGPDQFSLGWAERIFVTEGTPAPLWIEAVWVDEEDGTLYGWYHHEEHGVCRGSDLAVPRIGAVVSYDGGSSFTDLGYVLTSSDPVDCSARNGFFATGHGDFSVILDRNREYFYFYFTNYGGNVANQGIATARMRFDARMNPSGTVFKYFNGAWEEPGIGGRVTPVFRTRVAWQRSDTDSFWGPSIHWNTYLESYVILMNRACCSPRWPQEGVYVTFNDNLAAPHEWDTPARIIDGESIRVNAGFYPQVIGYGPDGTDTLAGQVARLYIHGVSRWELVFHRGYQTQPGVGRDDDDDRLDDGFWAH